MKRVNFLSRFLALAPILALAISCTESDERPVLNTGESQLTERSLKTKSASGARLSNSIYDGAAGDPISLETAKAWAANYRSKSPQAIRGHYFGFEILQQILNQANCSGIRMYYALDDKGVQQLILVGVDFEGNDILPAEGSALDGTGNIVADASFPCPDYCPDNGL